jgi:hypothetical protein
MTRVAIFKTHMWNSKHGFSLIQLVGVQILTKSNGKMLSKMNRTAVDVNIGNK